MAGICTAEELDALVKDYLEFDEFVVDVETKGPFRGDPHRNEVFWISLAGPGRADAIPCGHPVGERIIRDPDDPYYRIDPRTGRHQEHQINPSSGRPKWTDVPTPYTPAPPQLWVSEVIEALRPLFFSERRIIGQNVKFDLVSLAKYFGALPPGPYADTLVAAKLINENFIEGYSLGKMVAREFGYEYEKIGKAGPENFPYSEACLYSYLDSKYTWLLWEKFKRELKREKVRKVFDLEMALLPAIMDMEMTGVPIDETELEALGDEFSLELARLQHAIDTVAGHPVNLNANRQIAELIYDILGHTCTVFTASGERSTAKDTLEAFSSDPVIGKLLEHAALRKLQSTFIDGLKKTMVDGRVHPDVNQVGAVSGRVSCRSPNIQQIPSRSERGKRVRGVFVASPKHVLVVADLSQIELRMLAHLTKDTNLIRAYQNEVDLHGLLAERVFGKDYTPQQRGLAKNAQFSVLYGAGPETMVRRYQIPNVRVAQQLLRGFYRAYPRVGPWKQEVIESAQRTATRGSPPYVTTLLGRKRRLPALLWANESQRSAAQRQAISVTISGSAADLFKVAMLQCHTMLQEVAWEGHILMTVHDELVVEVPKAHAEEGLELVKLAMEDVANPFTGKPIISVPVVADAKIVARWSEMK